MLFNLSERDSIANQFLSELRDKNLQQDRMRFRRNVERLGEIMAYEVSKMLPYQTTLVETSLGESAVNVLAEQPVLITILRAGIPYFQGFINVFDKADAGFVGAFRKENGNQQELTIKLDYLVTPKLDQRIVILIDPMLATGKSALDTVKALAPYGKPKQVHIVSLIAASEGIDYLKKNLTLPYTLWTCVVDEKLNQQFYIVPGLGDAGDLSYGVKI